MTDPRYKTIKGLLKEGKEIKKFSDIFKWIPPSIVAKDLHCSYNKMQQIIKDPRELTVQQIFKLAELIGLDEKKFGFIIIDEVNDNLKNPDHG
jgi:hypothetical protein